MLDTTDKEKIEIFSKELENSKEDYCICNLSDKVLYGETKSKTYYMIMKEDLQPGTDLHKIVSTLK